MDKPSEDFVLPPTFIGVTCDTQATSKNSFYWFYWYFGFTSF